MRSARRIAPSATFPPWVISSAVCPSERSEANRSHVDSCSFGEGVGHRVVAKVRREQLTRVQRDVLRVCEHLVRCHVEHIVDAVNTSGDRQCGFASAWSRTAHNDRVCRSRRAQSPRHRQSRRRKGGGRVSFSGTLSMPADLDDHHKKAGA